jgi:hypothetical protein
MVHVTIVVSLGTVLMNVEKNNFNESKYGIQEGKFVDTEVEVSDNLKNLNLFISYVSLSEKIDYCNAWFLDSLSSIHINCYRDLFKTYHEKTNGPKIYLGDDRFHEIKGYGDVSINFPIGM